jgi:hypothetical protein
MKEKAAGREVSHPMLSPTPPIKLKKGRKEFILCQKENQSRN